MSIRKLPFLSAAAALVTILCGHAAFGAVAAGDSLFYSNTNLVGSAGVSYNQGAYGNLKLTIPATDELPAGSEVKLQSVALAVRDGYSATYPYLVFGQGNAYASDGTVVTGSEASFGGKTNIVYNYANGGLSLVVGTTYTGYFRSGAGGSVVGQTQQMHVLTSTTGYNVIGDVASGWTPMYEVKVTVKTLPYEHTISENTSISAIKAATGSDKALRLTVSNDAEVEADAALENGYVAFTADEAKTVTLKLSDEQKATVVALAQGVTYKVSNAIGVTPILSNVTLAFSNVPDGCVAVTVGGFPYIAKKTDSFSIKTGPRSADVGYITAAYDNTGAFAVPGALWNNTYASSQDNANNGYYNDILNPVDGNGTNLTTKFAFYACNTYQGNNGSPTANGNSMMTKTYIDDGGVAASTAWTVTDKEDTTSTMALPTPPNARGWQLRIADIPYEMYDLYIYVASDCGTIENNTLKACSMALSVDGGTTWKYYAGDPDNHATIASSSSATWKADPYSTGTLTEGTNYIKIRVSKGAFGADSVSTIDIVHAPRNTGSKVRSGLAGIQVVKVDSDGIYNRSATTGNWTTADSWITSDGTATTWANPTEGSVAYANINADNITGITVDNVITASSVNVSSTSAKTFTIDGTGTLTAPIDFSGYTGALKNPSFKLDGTMTFGDNSYLELNAEDASTVYTPEQHYSVIGQIKKTGAGTVKLEQIGDNAMAIEAGTLELAISNDTTSAGLITGTGNLVKSGAGTLTLTARNTYEGTTDIQSGTLKFGGSGNFSFWNGTARTVTVRTGATLDVNGATGYKANITLEEGAAWNNSGSEIGSSTAQAVGLTLTGDASVSTDTMFGLLGDSYSATTLTLGANTLTKNGSGTFLLYNTTVTGSGTLDIQNGTVQYITNKDADFSDADLTINLGDNGTFKVARWFTAKQVTGTGTLDLGIARITRDSGILLAEDSSICVKMQIRDKTANETFTIPCGGGTPRSVEFYYSDGTPCTTASATISDGKIYMVYDKDAAAPTMTYENPAVSDAAITYTWAFLGTEDSNWTTIGNWYSLSSSTSWVACANANAPGMRGTEGTNHYAPMVFDGNLMCAVPDADGYKCMSSPTGSDTMVDGYIASYGLYNHAKVTIGHLYGITCGDNQSDNYYVDATSKLLVSAGPDTNYGHVRTLNLYVAAKDGVEFAAKYNVASVNNYYLSGEGSVKFAGGIATKDGATNIVKQVAITIGSKTEDNRLGVVTRPIVSFAADDGTPTFDLSEVDVHFTDNAMTATAVDHKPSAIGQYRLYQTTDGVYVQYVGYSADASSMAFIINIR